jgi:hypothetical protein
MTISLRHLIESFIREDEEAEKRGWKHLGFGTWEDQSGNRFKKDSQGIWQPVGQDNWHPRFKTGATGNEPWFDEPKQTQPVQPKPVDTKATEREETKQTIAQQVTPLIDRDAIAAIDDEEEREHYSAMADLAELHDDDALEKALRDERMGDFVSDTMIEAGHRRQGDGLDHLDALSDALYNIADEVRRDGGRADAFTDYGPNHAAEDIMNGEARFGKDALYGMRLALAHGATDAAKYYAQQSAKKQQSGGVHDEYEKRVGELEGEGMTRSDAQGIADMEFDQKHGRGWERKGLSESSLREMIRRMSR